MAVLLKPLRATSAKMTYQRRCQSGCHFPPPPPQVALRWHRNLAWLSPRAAYRASPRGSLRGVSWGRALATQRPDAPRAESPVAGASSAVRRDLRQRHRRVRHRGRRRAARRAVPMQQCSPAETLPCARVVVLQPFVSLMKWSHFLLPAVPTAKCLQKAFPGE